MLVSKFRVWGKENDTKMEKTLSNNNYSFFICSWQYLFCHYQAEWEDKKCTAKKMDVVHWVFQLECRGWKIATNALFLFQERGRMEISCQLRLRRIDFCPFFVAKFFACFFCILKCILWNHKPQDQFLMKGFYLGVFDWLDGRSLCNEPPCWVITEIWSCIFFLSAFYSTLSTQRLKTTPGWAKMRNLLSKHQSET